MKKTIHFLKKIAYTILAIVVLVVIILFVTDNQYILKGISDVYLRGRTTASIEDSKDFYCDTIETAYPQPWKKAKNYNANPLTPTLQSYLQEFKTASFLVIQNGELVQEHYFEPYSSQSKTNSFSMAKSITTLLIGKAIEENYIESIDESMLKFIPEYSKDSLAKFCTIKDLTGMTSGFDWDDNYYFPVHHMAKAYYNDDMDEVVLTRKFIQKPGTIWEYQSGTTQLEGYVLKRAIKQPISSYLSEKLWKPLGMESDALWSLDHKNGTEKAYCCIHSNARDFAKLGQLMLQNGSWNGTQVIDSTFIKWMKTPTEISGKHYGQTIWIDSTWKHPFYMFRGHLGQYVICVPSHNLVIVRLGELRDTSVSKYSDFYHPNEVYIYIEETLKSIKNKS